MEDQQLRTILDHFDLSWRGYRKVRRGVKKRLGRHMGQLGCLTAEEYLQALDQDPALTSQAQELLTVTISRFFRDRRLWRDMELLLPALAQGPAPVRAWSAGCAGGEEAYTLAILWDRLSLTATLEIFATDSNPQALERTQAGVYPPSSLREVGHPTRERYFLPQPGSANLVLRPDLKKSLILRRHNLLHDPPPAQGLALIFLRNSILTYNQGAPLHAALRNIVASLRPGGFLVIGAHERLPEGFPELKPSGINRLILRRCP